MKFCVFFVYGIVCFVSMWVFLVETLHWVCANVSSVEFVETRVLNWSGGFKRWRECQSESQHEHR